MNIDKWKYCVVPIEDVTNEMAELGYYPSVNEMRHSVDGKYVIAKYKGKKPKILETYDDVDIRKELTKDMWIEKEDNGKGKNKTGE